MFKNVGQEIKEELQGVVFFITLIYLAVPTILVILLYNWGVIDEALAVGGGVIAISFIGMFGYVKARRNVMYRYAYGELVESAQHIRDYLVNRTSSDAPLTSPLNWWKCQKCTRLIRRTIDFVLVAAHRSQEYL